MSQSDPTDNALAAIASILDQTTTPPEPARVPAVAEDPPAAVALPPPLPDEIESKESEPEPIESIRPIEANGYTKVGPGPMAALRFRWTVREEDGRFFVDETVGEGSPPLVNGPMDRGAAIKFVDDREAAAQERFEHFRNEMINRRVIADYAPRHSDEG
ncbi:hypothetical protein JQ615_25960 [Bradyrhizobium jicamae]|uniref:Uncharacterized protein n=1 Tax=Bradyrhizobium jicamae TaxID=280332 RepID=A0ABS5FPY0_9BRAD|nr:hypothetical protein [Bradyrhizobium jicamae]MBR0798837.1 hypothetical protein [Bradyrhizobium jicamae]